MIDKISFKFGASENQTALNLEVNSITVFVGPNNSGKSRALIEIENYCCKTIGSTSNLIVSNIEFMPYEKEEIESEILKIEQIPKPEESIRPGDVILGKLNPENNQMHRVSVNKASLVSEAQNPVNRSPFYANFLKIYTIRLDGTNRLNLLYEQEAGDLLTTPHNILTYLFIDNELRKVVRRIVFDAFKKYFVIDPTKVGMLRARLSDIEPSNEREEKGWENEAINFHKNSIEIKYMSDGVKAFTGIVATILAGDPKIALIDEPEAFLHPSLSNRLGKEIAIALKGSRKRLFVSTHSASFLMGCIQSGSPLNIVRLTYNYNSPTARLLPQEKLLPLMRNPLLRSTGILEGLFYESVIVTEADSDRAFYQEINERLLANNDPRGISSCLFVNAQNKQTVWDIVKPLRELGIPALGIVDIDILKDAGQEWTKPLKGAFIPDVSHEALQTQRRSLLRILESTDKNFKKNGGINLLSETDKEACKNLFSQLNEYGLFIVPDGELESWLTNLGATGHGSRWLIDVFEKMGESPDDPNYLNPQSDDVWDFIGDAKNWLTDPNRKGIPSS